MTFAKRTHLVLLIILLLAGALLGATAVPQPTAAYGTMILDGLRDAGYGAPIATDPAGDLANPGPGGWSGTAWSDLTALYCQNDDATLYVYVDLPHYSQSTSSGQIGLLIDNGAAGGGAGDPWGNAITFAHANKPDYVIRGNIPGIGGNPPDDNNGWTELRAWSGSAWSAGGANWGGIGGGGQVGGKIAYANSQGVEFKIPLADIGNPALGTTLNLQFFTTQSGSSKGAYDTVPSDDQSTGWDDRHDAGQLRRLRAHRRRPHGDPHRDGHGRPQPHPHGDAHRHRRAALRLRGRRGRGRRRRDGRALSRQYRPGLQNAHRRHSAHGNGRFALADLPG
jgi:hypothetical protein